MCSGLSEQVNLFIIQHYDYSYRRIGYNSAVFFYKEQKECHVQIFPVHKQLRILCINLAAFPERFCPAYSGISADHVLSGPYQPYPVSNTFKHIHI